MSITDPWAYSDLSPSSRAASPLMRTDNDGTNNIDSELASIVSSLSILSNPTFNNPNNNGIVPGMSSNNNNNNKGLSPQIGSFRRSSITTTTSDGSIGGGNDDINNTLDSNDLSFLQKNMLNSSNNRKSPLSVGTAPNISGNNGTSQRMNLLGHYSASINGPLLFNNQQQNSATGGFFEKFGKTLIDGTKELEKNSGNLSASLSSTSIHSLYNDGNKSQTLIANSTDIVNPTFVRRSSFVSAVTDVTNATNISSTSSTSNEQSSEVSIEQNENFGRRNIWNIANISNMPIFKPGYSAAGPMNMFPYPGNNMGVTNHMMVPGQAPQTHPNGNPYYYVDGNFPYPPNNMPVYYDNLQNQATMKDTEKNDKTNNGKRSMNKNNNNNNNNINNGNKSKQMNPYLESHVQQNNMNSKPQKKTVQSSTQQQFGSHGKNGLNNNKANNNSKSPSQQYHRSPLLEEFRNNLTNKTYTLKDIFGSTLEFCKDQHGSRFIQQELASVAPSEREVTFNEIRDHILDLSDDVFGNYVIQKFFEFGSDTQKSVLVDKFRGRMQKLSTQMYACRVIQRALEFIDMPQKIDLVLELKDCVLPMIKDQNGNHVIQKAIERIPIDQLPFVLNSLNGQIYHLSTHAYGCRVIQRLLEFGSADDQTRILEELHDFIPYLVQDQYGNYVIQHILQQRDEDMIKKNMSPSIGKAKQEIIDIVAENVVKFSKHKFASNVVEKAILHGNKEQRRSIMVKILPHDLKHAADLEDDAPMILMMRDQFANYVVQKLVGVTDGEEKKLIVVAIRAYLDKLNSSNSLGNRHLASVEKLATLVENVQV